MSAQEQRTPATNGETLEALVEQLRRSERRLSEAQQLARLGSWEWDIAANKVVWSDELYRIYGLEPQAMEPTYEAFLARVHPDDRESVDQRNRKAFADHQPFEDVKRVLKPDGSVFLMRTQGEVVCDADGNPIRMLGVCEDVTAEVRAHEAEAMLASIVRSSNDAIYTVTRAATITTWNPAAERLFGYAAQEAIGMSALRLVPPSTLESDRRLFAAALALQAPAPWETTRVRRDGSRINVSLAVSPLHDGAGSVTGLSVIARDVTERKRFEAQLRFLAEHDALTGLYNRHRLDDELHRAIAQVARYGEPAALLLLDLDNFKYVNDTLGHGAGDELIRAVAATLRSRVRATDVLARLGGDEFAVVAPRADAEQARRLASDLLQAVRDHAQVLNGRRLRITTSIGAVALDPDAMPEDVLAAADRAMYEAKDAGRDRIVLYSDGTQRAAGPSGSWEHRIRDALDHDGFELHCQPILDLRSGEVKRYELLLRMRDAARGELILPSAFLGVAERLGLIHAIDRWVMGEALALIERHPGIEFEVNVSGRSIDDAELLTLVRDGLRRSGVDPARLIVEITETATIANMDDARRFAESLAALGCRFAIDDFGAGFGSFFYLKHLPAAYLKIDGDFVRSPRTRTDDLVIDAIVGMAKGLGKQTIAEFVGDAETVARLTAAGVDFAQGYHIGRPFPVGRLDR